MENPESYNARDIVVKSILSGLDGMAKACHENSKDHGFYDGYDMTGFQAQSTKIALVHSEATEVLEALRKEKGSYAVVEEIADILIRTLDLYWALRQAKVISENLEQVYIDKMVKNVSRPHMHGVLG